MTRFAKGRSGNPKGRPRKSPEPHVSAFDVIIDKRLTVTQGGRTRELTVEEALQLKTYEEALAGNRPARRQIMSMIAKREQWLASKAPRVAPITMSHEDDPDNANEALLILGVIGRASDTPDPNDPYDRYLLEPWAVQAALRRCVRRPPTEKQMAEIRRCTRNPDSLQWPRGVRE